MRKLKRQVERLLIREARGSSVQRELEQRANELSQEMADLEQGWNSALKTLELERAEHYERLEDLRAQIDQSPSAPSAESQHLRGGLGGAGGGAASKVESTAAAALEAKLLQLKEELQEAQAQAALARRQRVDAEVKAIALRKSLQRSNETVRSASPPRDLADHSRATRAQYDLFETFAGGSAERAGDWWATADERIRAERYHRAERPRDTKRDGHIHWSQSGLAAPAQSQGAAAVSIWRTTSIGLSQGAAATRQIERPGRLAAGVPQRTLSGTYAGRTWAQSWQDGETPAASDSRPASAPGDRDGMDGRPAQIRPERSQLTERDRGTQRHTGRQTETDTDRHRDASGPAAATTSRPRSADIMLRWAMQEQVEGLVPTASHTPFNSKALKKWR